MHIKDFIQLNDIKFNKFLTIVFTIQLLILFLFIINNQFSFDIYIFNQIIGFIYLTFIPGIIILRILKLHNIGKIRVVIYSIGLSLVHLMLVALIINILYPFFGIDKPLSHGSLIISILFVTSILLFFSYIRDKDSFYPHYICIKKGKSWILFLYLLPFLSIIGTYLMNVYLINYIIVILLIILSSFPILIAYDKIPKELFPLTVLIISISLLFHRSLISTQLWGGDIFEEYYFSKLSFESFFWNPTIGNNLNALLSITLLPTIYSYICNIDLMWVYKIVYPLIFSFTPLALYLFFNEQTSNEKMSFLAIFFFMSTTEFFGSIPVLVRQEIGMLFLALLLLQIVDKKISALSRSFFVIFFGIGLVVSHYALSYFYLTLLIAYYVIYYIIRRKSTEINLNKILFFGVFTIAWYAYLSLSSAFNEIVKIGNRIAVNIVEEFLNPSATEGLATILVGTTSLLYTVLKYLFFVSQFFITIGVISVSLVIISKKINITKNKISLTSISKSLDNLKVEYIIISIITFLILIAAIFVPYFSGNMGTLRLFQLTLMVLAPFFVIGFLALLKIISLTLGIRWDNKDNKNPLKIISAFLVIFLLFNAGIVHEFLNDPKPSSISLSMDQDYRQSAYIFSEKEVTGASFLGNFGDKSMNIDSDIFGRQVLRGYIYPKSRINVFREKAKEYFENNSYVYLREFNLAGKLMIIPLKKLEIERPYQEVNISNLSFFNELYDKNKIYVNGGVEIWSK